MTCNRINFQVKLYDYNARHDNNEQDGTLEKAAMAYLYSSVGNRKEGMKVWPWCLPFFKPKTQVRDLVRAGALIAAAIDRLCSKE